MLNRKPQNPIIRMHNKVLQGYCYFNYNLQNTLSFAKMRTVGTKAGKRQYVLQSVLGQGSFGKVYYSPPYAVKEMKLHSYLMNAIKNETSILSQLDHPNIVKLVDIFQEDSSLFMVMEYCQMDLSQYLRKYKLDEYKAIEIIKQVAAGLNCLFQRGVIHRDLKPANILVNNRNEFKLADFGLARYVQEYDSSLLQTIAGTPLYMAPQILKKSTYTTKCDIWSAGIIFYELLVGKLPWTASNEIQLYYNITNKPLNIPNNLSEWSRILLSKMIVVNQQQRIGWQELFEMIKNTSYNKSKSKTKDRPSSAKSQSNLSDRSPIKVAKECLNFPANKLKEMLILDMQQFFDDWTINKIVKDPLYKPNADQIPKIKQLLSCYNPQLQAWFLKDVPSLRLYCD